MVFWFESFAVLLLHSTAVVWAGCCYNTDCQHIYTGQDACFMNAVYTDAGESTSEAFCYDGSCFGFFGSDGNCEKKRSLGESCANAGGNSDNNFCVTGLCNAGVCALRKEGCRSATNCIQDVFSHEADSYGTTMPQVLPKNGSGTFTGTCDDISECAINAVIDPFSKAFDISDLVIELQEGLSMKLAGSMQMNLSPTITFNQKSPSLEAALEYTVSNSVTATLAGNREGEWKFDEEYLLTNFGGMCTNPKGSTCSPMQAYKGSFKVGHYPFVAEVGVQITAYVKGKASSKGSFESAATFTSSLSDKGSLILSPSDTKNPLKMNNGDATRILSAEMTSLTASAETSAKLNVVLGIEVTITVNGIGAEFAVQSKLAMEVDAKGASDNCVDGRAGIAGGIDIGTFLPSINIGTAAFSAFSGGLGDILGVAGSTQDGLIPADKADYGYVPAEQYDKYGTHCYINYLDLKDSPGDQQKASTDIQNLFTAMLSFIGCSKSASACTNLAKTDANTRYTSCSAGEGTEYKDVLHSCKPFKTVTSNYPNVCDDGKVSCFSAADTVTTPSGTAKALSELKIGEEILTSNSNGKLSFSKVVFLPHAKNKVITKFVEIGTSSGKMISATHKHLLMTCDDSLVRASSLTFGDCLKSVDGGDSIVSITETFKKGFMTVVTENEFAVVGGLVVSPFATTHRLVHWYYNFHRLAFKLFPSVCSYESVVSANIAIGSALYYIASTVDVEHSFT